MNIDYGSQNAIAHTYTRATRTARRNRTSRELLTFALALLLKGHCDTTQIFLYTDKTAHNPTKHSMNIMT